MEDAGAAQGEETVALVFKLKVPFTTPVKVRERRNTGRYRTAWEKASTIFHEKPTTTLAHQYQQQHQ